MAKKDVLVLEPKEVSFSETAILEYYIADSIMDSLKNFVESKKASLKLLGGKEGFVDSEGKTNFSVKDSDGLELSLTTTSGKKVFNQEKAINKLTEKFGAGVVDKNYSEYTITKKPKTEVPPDVLKILDKYFKVEKRYVLAEDTIWQSGLTQKEIEDCYDKGNDVLKVSKKSKVPTKYLVEKYHENKLDLVEKLLTDGV